MRSAVKIPSETDPAPSRAYGGKTVCGLLLGLLVAAGPLHAQPVPGTTVTASETYGRAQARFDAGDPAGAMALLDQAPAEGGDRLLADRANLRGAILLRRHRYEEARQAFAEAIKRDPRLWAARYNVAESSFREGDYAGAARQFAELSRQTDGLGQFRERRFLQYKLLLAQMLAGEEHPAQDFLARYRGVKAPPLAYYYLAAAAEQKRGRTDEAGQWLAQAQAQYPPAAGQYFAESFQALGWPTQPTQRLVAVVDRRRADVDTPPVMETAAEPSVPVVRPAARPTSRVAKPAVQPVPATKAKALAAASTSTVGKSAAAPAPKTGGTLQETSKPAFHTEEGPTVISAPLPAFRAGQPLARDVNGQMPPVIDESQPQTLVEYAVESRLGQDGPAVLGKPSTGRRNRGASSPAPSASPAAGSEASAASTASPSPSATPGPAGGQPGATPAPAFMQKYEAAYVKFLEKNYLEARILLDEADGLQPNQPSSTNLRAQIFKAYYENAYVTFRKGDYPAALQQLEQADSTQPNNPDAYNLRGLVLSRQRNYEQAEAAFKKASQLDPSFYAAKFNYAELPFNYRNYTVARTRFEELFSQTDPTKQPVETEITQFKVFLTLLLEGKVDGARAFMDHFRFTGATPARYFCQAALDFYSGNMTKAQGWIDSAGKEFDQKLVAIFKESFYRIGWITDATSGTLAASPPPATTPVPSASPELAQATPAPSPAPTALPTVAMVTPIPAPTAAVVTANAPSATPAATASATPAATPVLAHETPVPAAAANEGGAGDTAVRLFIIGGVLVATMFNVFQIMAVSRRHRERRLAARRKQPVYSGGGAAPEPEEAQTRR